MRNRLGGRIGADELPVQPENVQVVQVSVNPRPHQVEVLVGAGQRLLVVQVGVVQAGATVAEFAARGEQPVVSQVNPLQRIEQKRLGVVWIVQVAEIHVEEGVRVLAPLEVRVARPVLQFAVLQEVVERVVPRPRGGDVEVARARVCDDGRRDLFPKRLGAFRLAGWTRPRSLHPRRRRQAGLVRRRRPLRNRPAARPRSRRRGRQGRIGGRGRRGRRLSSPRRGAEQHRGSHQDGGDNPGAGVGSPGALGDVFHRWSSLLVRTSGRSGQPASRTPGCRLRGFMTALPQTGMGAAQPTQAVDSYRPPKLRAFNRTVKLGRPGD